MKDWFEWGPVSDSRLRKATGIPEIVPNMLNLGFFWSSGRARALVLVVSVRFIVYWCTDRSRNKIPGLFLKL